ncbi:MAG: ABC transporter permease [Dehalococcoidia bacterium]
MGRYLIHRILLIFPTLFGITVIVFMMVRFLPGDVIDVILGDFGSITPEQKEELRDYYNLNAPLHSQYKDWMWDVLRGDLGVSILSGRSIAGDMRSRIPVTFELAVTAAVIGLLIAVPVGIIAAIRQDSALDYSARGTAVGMLSLPNFWIATLVITIPNRLIGWAPPIVYKRFEDDPLQNLYIMAIPAAILGFGVAGPQLRIMRTQLLEVMRQDYIRTAWAKGLRERVVIARHALKNALIPVVTLIGVQIPILLGGTVILEVIFGLPGIGQWLVYSLFQRDYPVVQAVNLLLGVIVVVVNLIVDMTYAYLDPRIRYG